MGLTLKLWHVGISVLTAIVQGGVLSLLWKWFVVPIFDLPELPLVAAIGIMLLFSFLAFVLRGRRQMSKAEQVALGALTQEEAYFKLRTTHFILMLFAAVVVLVLAWILQLFM